MKNLPTLRRHAVALAALALAASLGAAAAHADDASNNAATPAAATTTTSTATAAASTTHDTAKHKHKKKSKATRKQQSQASTSQAAPSAASPAVSNVQARPPATSVDRLIEPNAAATLSSGTPDASANDSVRADNPPRASTAQSDQAASQGFIGDSHLMLNLRNYADVQDVTGGPHRHAWTQGAMLDYTSGFTQGLIGFGVDASLYGAFKFDGGQGAGNMVHVSKDGGGQNQFAWAFPGIYDVKARVSDTVVKYGLQITSDNPFFEPHDNRALSPTFLGVSLVSKDIANVVLQGGSFTKVDLRGHSNLVDLSTSYGDVKFKRFSFVGGSWDYSPSGSLSLFANQADSVWRQYYGSVQQSIGDPSTLKWTGFANVYSTHGVGGGLEGPINNNAYSVSLAAQHGPHSLLVGYQQILGDQFFDYVNETNGIYLVNSMDVDYNAPHEKSFQVRYGFDGKYAGFPGAKAMLWYALGWGADGSASAAANGPGSQLYGLYWKDGQPVHGSHHEFGFIPSYKIQSGRFKDTTVAFTAMWHHGSKYYSDPSNMEYRLLVSMPLKLF